MLEPKQVDSTMSRPDGLAEANFALLGQARRLCDAASALGKRQEKYDVAPDTPTISLRLEQLHNDIAIVVTLLADVSERIEARPLAGPPPGSGPQQVSDDIMSKLSYLRSLVASADSLARHIATAV